MKIKIAGRILWVADVLVAVAVILAAVKVFAWAPSGGEGAASPAPVVAATPGGAGEPLSRREVRDIIQSGTIVPLPPPPPPRVEAPPAPKGEPEVVDVLHNFKYKLIGTIIEPDASYAFFEDPGGVQKVAARGERIDGALVAGVASDHVTIEIGGRQGTLYQAKPDERFASPTAYVASAPRPTRAITAAPAETAEDDQEDAGDEEFGEDEEELDWNVIPEDQYLDYVQNVGKYVSQVTVLSHFNADKKPDGLILTRVPTDSEAYKRGLREGDIVKSIQEQPVTDLQAAMKVAYQVLRDNEYLVDVVIERNGAEEVLSYEVWPE